LSSFRRLDRGRRDPKLDAFPVEHHDMRTLGARQPRSGRHAEPPAVQRVAGVDDGHLFVGGVT
jgi:hypothetical protein